MNIISNFIPNEIKRILPCDPPCITKPLKTMLNKKNRFFLKATKGMDINQRTKLGWTTFVKDVRKQSKHARLTYVTNIGNRLSNANTNQKIYWKIINVMNKYKQNIFLSFFKIYFWKSHKASGSMALQRDYITEFLIDGGGGGYPGTDRLNEIDFEVLRTESGLGAIDYRTVTKKIMDKEGVNSGSDDKRAITATFAITLDDKFLTLQLIYLNYSS